MTDAARSGVLYGRKVSKLRTDAYDVHFREMMRTLAHGLYFWKMAAWGIDHFSKKPWICDG